jgi:hypothetical protein
LVITAALHESAGRFASERPKFFDHVHLIEISQIVSHIEPPASGRTLPIESQLKTSQPAEQLR